MNLYRWEFFTGLVFHFLRNHQDQRPALLAKLLSYRMNKRSGICIFYNGPLVKTTS